MSSTYERPPLWLMLTLGWAIGMVLFLAPRFQPSKQGGSLNTPLTNAAQRHASVRSLRPAARDTALPQATPAPKPNSHVSLPSDPVAELAHRSPSRDDDDDEIALFDNNLIRLRHSEHLFQAEQAQRLFDEHETKRLSAELQELSAGLPFPARARVLCTASICEVNWQSGEALESLIPELAPWLLTQASYAVAESAEPIETDVDVTKALRLFLPNVPRLPLEN